MNELAENKHGRTSSIYLASLFKEGKKRCYKCKTIKSKDLFYKNIRRKDGLEPVCVPCKDDYYYKNKERALAKIQRKRIKVLRKMYKARKNVEIKGKKRDIIEDYANFGSTVYAPITRDGLSLDKKANKYEV